MYGTRRALLQHIGDTLVSLKPTQPVLVGIDGRSAAGKTTLADELAAFLEHRRPTLRSSIDHFHPPGHKYRSMAGGYTPESYYSEGYDYTTFRQSVVAPLQQHGTRLWKRASWDSYHDCAYDEPWMTAPADAIVLVDGIFLLHPELRSSWEYLIWLDIDWETMIERAAARDTAWVGSRAAVIERYRSFWIPTHQLYEEQCTPIHIAQCVVDNRDPSRATLCAAPITENES
jgi:uridine kinase